MVIVIVASFSLGSLVFTSVTSDFCQAFLCCKRGSHRTRRHRYVKGTGDRWVVAGGRSRGPKVGRNWDREKKCRASVHMCRL